MKRIIRRTVSDVIRNPSEDEYVVLTARYWPTWYDKSLSDSDCAFDAHDRTLAPSEELFDRFEEMSWLEWRDAFVEELDESYLYRRAEEHQEDAEGKQVVFSCFESNRDPECHVWIMLQMLEETYPSTLDDFY